MAAAPIRITIDSRRVKAFMTEKLRQLPGVERSLLRRTAIFVAGVAKSLAPVDRGELRAKIEIKEHSNERLEVISGAKYSEFVERGTRAHIPPFAPIERWALRRGLPPGAVWRSIGQKGTKAHPFMQPAVRAGDRVFKRWADEAIRNWVA